MVIAGQLDLGIDIDLGTRFRNTLRQLRANALHPLQLAVGSMKNAHRRPKLLKQTLPRQRPDARDQRKHQLFAKLVIGRVGW